MATLQYDFRVVGINSVMAAFRSLERRAAEHNRKVDQMFGGGRGGGGGARGGGAMRAGGAGQQSDAHVREFNRVRAVRAKNDAAVLREETRKNKEWINFKNRLNNDRIKVEENHAKKQVDIARRMENDRVKEVKKANNERERITRKSYAAARSKAGRRYDAGVGALTSLGSMAASAIALGGGAVIASSINNELKLGKSAAMLAGLYKQAGGTGNIKNVEKGITSHARLVGKQTGADRENIIQGMTSFFGVSGNVDVAKELSAFFVDMSQITGASMEDVGALAGDAFFQGMLKNMSPDEAKKATEEIVRTLAGHAARGSINFEHYVKTGKSIMSTSARFGGNFADTVGLVSAIAQTTPGGGANSAPEAATALARFADALPELSKKGGSFEKMGVNAFTPNKFGVPVLRNPFELIKDILRKTKGGSEQELVKFGFNIRARKAVTGFQSLYRDAGGGEAGMKAVEAHLATFSKARVSPEIQKQVVANLRSTPAMQFEAAMNDLKDNVGQSLLPALTKIAPAMARLVTAMEPVISWLGKFAEALADNPWGTIIETITAAIVGSIAKQAIGEAIRGQIIQMLTANGIPVASATPGAVGVPGAVGAPRALAQTLGKVALYAQLVQLEGDTVSKTSAEVQEQQEAATKKAYEQLKKTGTMDVETSRRIGPFGLIKENYTAKNVGPNELAQIPLQDLIKQFGRQGALDLGFIDEQGKELPPQKAGTRMQELEKERAAEMLQESAKALQIAATRLGAGGLFSSLFGGLNRGTGPQEPSPGSR